MRAAIQRDWWLKSLSGTVLGASLALGLVGLWAWWGPGGLREPDKVQFNMWMIAPLWMLALCTVYFMRSGARALLALLTLNALAYGLLMWAQGGAGA
ncbi:hypothetical protein H5407_11960 [Mitsuaria sp. WAJ17]|uniref:hypothetical protein n=1 Tax=Mitsuaria sp. WAJ17 TaxID=2761452 RepID=UPI0016007160|nr:hypothetical protein [Mitsuaria sp. WAJ17]MBB2485935.1 hypothetical protein [Mitsuaria sp. WAJ17]